MVYIAFAVILIIVFAAGVLVGRKNKGKGDQAFLAANAEADRLKKKLDNMK